MADEENATRDELTRPWPSLELWPTKRLIAMALALGDLLEGKDLAVPVLVEFLRELAKRLELHSDAAQGAVDDDR